ncbi:antiterminator Q family protein [Serratia sp. M24T3]|uniref:Antiterminator Q family protein n=1 Tax=Rouxiella sp. WC2420 TaxID=3234145 RepID=A0AB39VNI1_9GAMM|nr:antiterminator Q family protein [Serratia sp. M24T3]EIC83588.1 phage antitermination protein Q [Serratia sp. M24T3]
MRDIPQVLERWGGWAAADHSQLDWQKTAAGFRGLLPRPSSSRISCCDDDGLLIDGCVTRLQTSRPEEYQLLILHYVMKQPKRAIARSIKRDEKLVRIMLQMAEGFVEGCLAMLDVKLDMDPIVEIYREPKEIFTRSAISRLLYQ